MAQSTRPRKIIVYADAQGGEPFTEWLYSFKDSRTRQRIENRIDRMETGNYGDFKSLKDGLFELRFFFGSGYRVYFAEDGDTVVLLLSGGDKSTQDKDIKAAREYWKEYKTND
tara:strand:- start:599 stop:937 length:339 start_codon:yes stop_codon:yes gene_type:complete